MILLIQQSANSGCLVCGNGYEPNVSGSTCLIGSVDMNSTTLLVMDMIRQDQMRRLASLTSRQSAPVSRASTRTQSEGSKGQGKAEQSRETGKKRGGGRGCAPRSR